MALRRRTKGISRDVDTFNLLAVCSISGGSARHGRGAACLISPAAALSFSSCKSANIISMENQIFSKDDVRGFQKFYGQILSNIITKGQTERTALRMSENDLLDLIDADVFNEIWRCSSCFPPATDFMSERRYTYQTTAYIGYLRGVSDTLDMLSRLIGDELSGDEYKDFLKCKAAMPCKSALDGIGESGKA